MTGLSARWQRFWFAGAPSDALALVRVFLGLSCVLRFTGLYGFANRMVAGSFSLGLPLHRFDARHWRFDDVPVPLFDGAPSLSLMTYRDLESAALVLGALLMLGLGTRVVGPLLALVLLATQLFDQAAFKHHMFTLGVAVLVVGLAPGSSDRFSLDATLALRSGSTTRSVLPLRMLQTMVTAIYLFSTLAKLNASWFTGWLFAWTVRHGPDSGTLLSAIQRSDAVRPLWVGLSWAALAMEAFLIVALWVPRWRAWGFAVGVALHIGIELALDVGSYSSTMVALYAAFLAPATRARLVRFDARSSRARALAWAVRVLDWAARFQVVAGVPVAGPVDIVDRRGRVRARGAGALWQDRAAAAPHLRHRRRRQRVVAAAPVGYTMSMFTRRGFLQRAGLAGGALLLPSGGLLTSVGCAPSADARRTPHYFVFYFMMGGWDLVLTTEPVPPKGDRIWIPYEQDDVVDIGGHRFGPAMAPLKPFAAKMGALRGIYVDALNHPQARIRMCTGRFKAPGEKPSASVQAILADHLGKAYEIPNLSSDTMRPSTFRGPGMDERLEPVRVASIDQLKGMVGWKGDIAKYKRDVQDALQKKDALLAQRYADTPLAQDFHAYAELARRTLQSDYPERVRAMPSLTEVAQERTVKNANLAVEAVRQDIAPVITVGSGEFDSHTRSQYGGHMAAVAKGIKTVAMIAAGLEDTPMPGNKTLLDHTTIVVTSEFSRDPMKNELGGKHHWPGNTMLLIGKGVKRSGGRPTLVGECDDGVNPQPINPSNGSTRRGAELIEVPHALATVLTMAGIDPAPHFGPYDPVVPLLG